MVMYFVIDDWTGLESLEAFFVNAKTEHLLKVKSVGWLERNFKF